MGNRGLLAARSDAKDEFYTQLEDVEIELSKYKSHFKDKSVFLNCNDSSSAFYQYFYENFSHLGLKKLYATSYSPPPTLFDWEEFTPTVLVEYDGEIERVTELEGTGDFRSEEASQL